MAFKPVGLTCVYRLILAILVFHFYISTGIPGGPSVSRHEGVEAMIVDESCVLHLCDLTKPH